MKSILKNYFTKPYPQIISAVVLTGILSLSTDLTLLQSATAAPRNLSQEAAGEMVKCKGLASLNDHTNPLPRPVANAVLQELSRRVGIPVGKLTINNFSRETWPNGCLGLPQPDELCTQALVEGWRITLSNGRQTWVYRTDSQGRVLRLENQTVRIPTSELPPPLRPGVIFREITSGGFAGLTYETNLLNDGRVIRTQVNFNGTTSQTQTYQISRQQVRQFQQLLQQFAQFNQLSYPYTSGSADYITFTLTSPAGTTRYTDINQDRLPRSLQQIIQAWNQLLSSTPFHVQRVRHDTVLQG